MMNLIDPHTHSWDACYDFYSVTRAKQLENAMAVRRRLRLLEKEFMLDMNQNHGRHIAWAKQQTMMDRMRVLAINIVMVQRAMGSLRDYIEVCRVVHGKRDRVEFHLLEEAIKLGLDPAEVREAFRRGDIVKPIH